MASEDNGRGLFVYRVYEEFSFKYREAARCMAIVIDSFSKFYNETPRQGVNNVTGRKLKPGEIVIINLFRRRIS